MTRYTFGKALSDDDVMELQGVEYKMQPLGMRAMRAALTQAQSEAAGEVAISERLSAMIDLILASVRPEERDRLRAHIEESVGFDLILEMGQALMKGVSDLDPTQRGSSSDGSPPTGSTSTDGAQPTVLTPST